ncbi:MAG TPA: glycoside hydrolase family 88 protein, partial [Prolixibacteraceae bacterium]|nr:glycoside hydrolase family 88 protein [Prolixibacteraceae bacterium]
MRTFSILLLLFSLVSTARAQSSPEPETILKKMQLANQYFMDKWPDPGKTIITNRERPSNIWTRAVYYEGLMGLYSINPDTAYYRYAADWAEFHQWGFRSGNQTRNADDYCCAQTYIDLYTIDPKPERIANVFACMDHLLSLPESDA